MEVDSVDFDHSEVVEAEDCAKGDEEDYQANSKTKSEQKMSSAEDDEDALLENAGDDVEGEAEGMWIVPALQFVNGKCFLDDCACA